VEKRTIITVAGAITLTVLASSSALAANFRGADDNSPGDVGTFTPKDATSVAPQVATVYVDVPATPTSVAPLPAAPLPAATVAAATVAAPPAPAATLDAPTGSTSPVTTTQASSSGSDDGHKGEGEAEAETSHSEDGGGHGDD
jgi:hypothetical protein